MRSLVRSPKDFWSGVIYLAIALCGLVVGSNYSIGRSGQMGPGYFPIIISSLLLIFGLVAVTRSLVMPGEPIDKFALKPAVLIVGSVVLFGFLVERTGFIAALLIGLLLCASASRQFRFEWRAALGLVVFVSVSALLFVKALGVPMPLIGSWFSPA